MLEYKLDVASFIENLQKAKEKSIHDMFTDEDRLFKRFVEEKDVSKLEEFSFEELDFMLLNIGTLSEKYSHIDRDSNDFLMRIESSKSVKKGGKVWW